MSNNSRVAEGDNSKLKVPGDRIEAVKFVWGRLTKLQADRAWIADQIKDLNREAKDAGIAGASIRTALKLGRMTPEERQKWKDQIHAAAALFGYEVADSDEMPDKKAPLWGYTQRALNIVENKKGVSDDLRELAGVANEANINFKALRELAGLVNRQKRDEEFSPVDYFDELDNLGEILGIWER